MAPQEPEDWPLQFERRVNAGELDAALAEWRGLPYLELEGAPAAVAERARLEELRLVALEDRAVAALELGNHATVAAVSSRPRRCTSPLTD